MSRFKIGQKVVCVDDKEQYRVRKALIKGKVYRVVGFNPYFDEGVLVDGALSKNDFDGFWSYRFAPLQEDGSTKALVECVEELKLEEIEPI